jgi:hypothetical protein
VRALTDSEARVIAVLLASRPDRERERLHLIDVPRSTYHAVRRRAYEEGWLKDRYVPHPVPLGRPFVTFLLVRPYADRSDELLRTLATDPAAVLVWASGAVTLGVLFHRSAEASQKLVAGLVGGKLCAAPLAVTVRADGPSVPVYFDFEGLWAHLAGLDGTLAYPHGLGGAGAVGAEESVPELTSHQRWAISELLRRPFSLSDGFKGGHLVGPLGLPFSQRKMLQRGWVVHRTLLEPARLPSYGDRAASQVVLITGAPRPGARPESLFASLTGASSVFPFLFVVGPDLWMIGALGGAGASSTPDRGLRRPVLPTIRGFLEGIEIVQEAATSFVAPVDHRYDRLLPVEEPPGSPKC